MMSLAEAAAVLQGRASGADLRFSGVSTDSRRIERGDLFVALRGEPLPPPRPARPPR